MVKAARRIKYEDCPKDVPALLELVEQQQEPVELEHNGHVYRIESVKEYKHDPEAVRKALRESAGALKGVDIDELKRDLREMGYQDTTHRPWLE
jgi:hypothetical protein